MEIFLHRPTGTAHKQTGPPKKERLVNSEEEVEFCEELFDAEISRIVGILRSSMMSTVLEAWLKSKMGESLMFQDSPLRMGSFSSAPF